MKPSRTFLLIAAAALGADGLAAQTPVSVTEFESPNPADFEIIAEETPPSFAQLPNAIPMPPPPNSRQSRAVQLSAEAQQYRLVVKNLQRNRHQFIHCQLKSGKILTGLIRGDNDQGFTLHTNALGGPFVRYEDLVDAPKSVPAVGTRFKMGAQWTGFGIGLAAAIPLIIILLPLVFSGVLQD